jgi:hypothetical protein
MKAYGETHCPYCERPLATDDDYDKYKPEEGEHLCWNYPCHDCHNCQKTAEERLIEVLHRRDELEGMLEEALVAAEEKV